MLGGSGLPGLKSGPTAEGGSESVDDLLKRVNNSLASAGSLTQPSHGSAAAAPVTAAPSFIAGGQGSAQSAPVASAPGIDPLTYQRMLFVEQQNKQLSRELQQARQALLQKGAATSGQFPDEPYAMPQPAAVSSPLASASVSDLNAIAPPSPAPAPGLQRSTPELRGAAGTATRQAPVISASSVKFELENISPATGGVKLTVVLKNDQDVALPIEKEMTGVVRSSGHPDGTVTVSFQRNTVPAHGKTTGAIKIPTQLMVPNSDLFLPNFLPPDSPQRDIHLTASLEHQH